MRSVLQEAREGKRVTVGEVSSPPLEPFFVVAA